MSCCFRVWALCIASLLVVVSCSEDEGFPFFDAGPGGDSDTDSDTDGDTDMDADSDGDTDADTDTDSDTGTGGGSSGCGKEPPSGGIKKIDVNSNERKYVLKIPKEYDPDNPYPLVFGFHGATSNAAEFGWYFGVDKAAGKNAIVVMPDALVHGGETSWEFSIGVTDDLRFFDAMIEEINETLCIDPERIFSSGHSSGGYFSNYIGCKRGDILRAIAPVAAGGPWQGGCKGQVAAWITHGETDTTVPFSQGEISRDYWKKDNGCSNTTVPVDPVANCLEFEDCDDGYPVQWCPHAQEDMWTGGHCWPNFAGNAIWNFFALF